MNFDRKIYFDAVRPMFGQMSQEQVDGQNYLLDFFETTDLSDLRFQAYMLATTKHETASTMLPIEEYGKGKGHSYGQPHPETGQIYYGRGDVQLTHYDNYLYADQQLSLSGDKSLVEFPENALDPKIAAMIMDRGMREGWFRKGNALEDYFNSQKDDPYNAREIINGDKHIVPNWSGGENIGTIIADYHETFLEALEKSLTKTEKFIRISVPRGTKVIVEEHD